MTTPGRFAGQQVAVLYGGETSEREVSLRTGAAIAAALESRGQDVLLVDWASSRLSELAAMARGEIAAAFIALHGGAGENGELQGALEVIGLPYTGSGVLASALAMDKARSKALAAGAGLPTAPWDVWTREKAQRALEEGVCESPMTPPFVVKPTSDGSSVGVSIVRSADGFAEAVQRALLGRGDVLIERYVDGAELTVAVVNGRSLGVCEVQPGDGFYDYASKYERGDTQYLVPSTFPREVETELEALATQIYELMGCRGVARVDFIVSQDGAPFLLEVNTVPGMTDASLVPKIAEAAGMDFASLTAWLLEGASLDSGGS